MRADKILVAQGGGPTAVINQSLVGVITAAQKKFSKIYGARHGVRGIIDQSLVDLGRMGAATLEKVAATPGAALGSTRDKPDDSYCRTILNVLQAHAINHIVYIGGNDSSDSLRILAQKAQAARYPLRCLHVPKTIDNDLVKNDHTPGFGSAARYVATAFAGINQDNSALPGVYIGVVMGRHAGFLTAAAAALRRNKEDGPHLIYPPERPFMIDAVVEDVKAVMEQFGRCVIAVSEGIADENGHAIAAKLAAHKEQDAHGNIQLSGSGALGDMLAHRLRDGLGVKRVRADTLGYLQRCFAECVSLSDAREARQAGEAAIKLGIKYQRNGSVTINRVHPIGQPYKVVYDLVPLAAVAGKTRLMPTDFLDRRYPDVSQKFLRYIQPLIGPNPVKTASLTARMIAALPVS